MIQLIMFLVKIFSKAQEEKAQPQSAPARPAPAPTLDWSSPEAKISKYFTVKDATWLPSWGISHMPSEDEKARILLTAQKMDLIRDLLGEAIRVHVWMRPGKVSAPGSKWDGQDYNDWLYKNVIWKGLSDQEKAGKKVPNSPHKMGDAVDWSVMSDASKERCAKVRAQLLPKLDEWQIRMENMDGGWVHIDTRSVGPSGRFFKP